MIAITFFRLRYQVKCIAWFKRRIELDRVESGFYFTAAAQKYLQ